MVLKAKNTGIPAFEGEEKGAAPAPVSDAAAAPSPADVAGAQAATAIAKAATTAVAKPQLKVTAAFGDMQDALPEVDFGTFPRITVDLGGFEKDKEVIGDNIKLELMSWTNRYVVTPNVDNKEANGLVKYSNDGVTLSDGSGVSVADYLNKLKTVDGYDEASVKTYIDLTGLLVEAGGKAIPEDEQEIVQVQLSPQSVKQFNGYRITKGVMEARSGAAVSNTISLTRERGEYNSNKFAFVKFK